MNINKLFKNSKGYTVLNFTKRAFGRFIPIELSIPPYTPAGIWYITAMASNCSNAQQFVASFYVENKGKLTV